MSFIELRNESHKALFVRLNKRITIDSKTSTSIFCYFSDKTALPVVSRSLLDTLKFKKCYNNLIVLIATLEDSIFYKV